MGSGGERRAMWSGDERREIENWGKVRRAMGSVGEMMAMENGGETTEVVMCSTCSGFVLRKKRIAMDPNEEVVEVVTEAEKMRDLMQAVFRHGPFQEKEPAEATKEQWQVLRRRRMIMMETKRCPACSHSLLNMCATCSRSLSEKPGPLEEDKAAGSKENKKSSREEVSELMAVLPSQGGKERNKIATEDEAMVANARSVQKSKRSREEGKRSSSGLKKKKKAKSEDKEGSGSEKKAKRSSETEGSGSKEAETEGSGSREEAKMEVSESAGGNGKTKMVTRRMDKKSIDILKNRPPVKPFTFTTDDPLTQCMFASDIAQYEVDWEFHEYLQRQSLIRGYAEYQLEVTDDEDE